MSIQIHQIPLFISVRSPEDDPRTLPPAVFHDSHMGLVARIGSKFRIQTRLPDLLRRQGVLPTETPLRQRARSYVFGNRDLDLLLSAWADFNSHHYVAGSPT
jgi:hypothetical protein